MLNMLHCYYIFHIPYCILYNLIPLGNIHLYISNIPFHHSLTFCIYSLMHQINIHSSLNMYHQNMLCRMQIRQNMFDNLNCTVNNCFLYPNNIHLNISYIHGLYCLYIFHHLFSISICYCSINNYFHILCICLFLDINIKQ